MLEKIYVRVLGYMNQKFNGNKELIMRLDYSNSLYIAIRFESSETKGKHDLLVLYTTCNFKIYRISPKFCNWCSIELIKFFLQS